MPDDWLHWAVGEVLMPVTRADDEKRLDLEEFGTKVKRVLNKPFYPQSASRISDSMVHFGGARGTSQRLEEFLARRVDAPTEADCSMQAGLLCFTERRKSAVYFFAGRRCMFGG
jgi:hypothetical protein